MNTELDKCLANAACEESGLTSRCPPATGTKHKLAIPNNTSDTCGTLDKTGAFGAMVCCEPRHTPATTRLYGCLAGPIPQKGS